MIRINVALRVKSENKEKLLAVLRELAVQSRQEEGCVGYAIFSNVMEADQLEIIETWADAGVLEAHRHTEHFIRLVPRMIALSEEKTTDKFTYEVI